MQTVGAPLPIPQKKFKAYLFDCDGTLADTMPLHQAAWNKTFAPWGITFEDELFYASAGRTTQEILKGFSERTGITFDPGAFEHQKEAHFLELLHHVQPIAPVMWHFKDAVGKIPIAVVSGGHKETVDLTLRALGVRDQVQALVCAGDYARGKPHPDPFLLAAQQLGIPPADCLVFEDADLGVQSAIAAGMEWVRVYRHDYIA